MTDQTCSCGRPTSGAWLCDDCTKTLSWALVNIAAYYPDLDTIARKQARYGNAGATKGSIGKEQPLVVDLRFAGTSEPGSQLRWDAWNTIVAWCRTVMKDQPEVAGRACGHPCLHVDCATIRRRRWPANNVPSMCAYLARQLRYVLTQTWAPAMLDELLDLERRLKRMVDRPADRWYAGKCSTRTMGDADSPEVGTCSVELYARTDRGIIKCPGCGTEHNIAERREFLLAEAKDYHVTATEAAAALLAWTDYDGSEAKLVARIVKWRDRGQLEVADVTSLHGRDRHLYRLGDIQDRMIAAAQDAQARSLDTAGGRAC